MDHARPAPTRSAVLSLIVGCLCAAAGGAPLSAQAGAALTRVQVRVLAHDAKLIGDAVGGARITITSVATGDTLAQGVTAGSTGDTKRIMESPRERGAVVFDTPGAAGWLATFELQRPTEVEIVAEGPLKYSQAEARASRRMLLAPGVEILGDGVVLELHGFIVEILDAGAAMTAAEIPVRARVRMLCSCPTQPGGLWSVETIRARLLDHGRVVAEAPLDYTGTTSEYAGAIRAPGAGTYTLEVLASDSRTANFGMASREVEAPSSGGAVRESSRRAGRRDDP